MPWSRKLPALRPLLDICGRQSDPSSLLVRRCFFFKNDVEHVCNLHHVVVCSEMVQAMGVHENTVCVSLNIANSGAKLLSNLAELLELLAEGVRRDWAGSTEEVGRVSSGDNVLGERRRVARD